MTDDCSTDKTYEIISELGLADTRVRPYRNSVNSGAAVSRNNSMANAKGDYIAFLDADDLWMPEKLEIQVKEMEQHQHAFTFTAYGLVDESGRTLNKEIDCVQITPLSYEDMLRKKATMGCSTVMLDQNAFDDLSMPLIRTGQDYALWLKLLRSGVMAVPINQVLTLYRIRPDSISRNKAKKAIRQWQIYRKLENLSVAKSFQCFLFYAWRAISR